MAGTPGTPYHYLIRSRGSKLGTELGHILPAKWKFLFDFTLGIRVFLKQRISLLLFGAIMHVIYSALLIISVTGARIILSFMTRGHTYHLQ